MNLKRIHEVLLELNQLRVEQMLEFQTRNERMKQLLQELESLTTDILRKAGTA